MNDCTPDVDFGREVAATFRTDAAMVDTKPIPACTLETAARFLAKVEVDGCLRWTACLDRDGYGRIKLDGRTYQAHRVALAWSIGGIPPGYTASHKCHDDDPTCLGGVNCLHRRCVRPDHLVAESMRDNLLAGNTINADHIARNRCPQGHALAGINLRSAALRKACRTCRICHVVYSRAYHQVRRHGGTTAEARNAGRRAIAALTGLETPTSIGLEPLQVHYETDLFTWGQSAFDFEQVG